MAEFQPLKEIYNRAFYKQLAGLLKDAHPSIKPDAFLKDVTRGLNKLELKERLRRTTETCRAHLPNDYRKAVDVLKRVAPHIEDDKGGLAGMFVPDFIELYGCSEAEFDFSMEALAEVTVYSSSEFAVRRFLELDFKRALAYMRKWSGHENEHVRRLSSEGARPRLPWSFQLRGLVADPKPVRPILEKLRADPSLYVRTSVANHLNDISKDHPEWMLDLMSSWDLKNEHTAWIVKKAARSLIKAGHPRSFALFGFEKKPSVRVADFKLKPAAVKIGSDATFELRLISGKKKSQKLAVDYIIHYVKKDGRQSPKVFKLKELDLEGEIILVKKQSFRDFTTRTHHPGKHRLEIVVNGNKVAALGFEVSRK